MDRSVNIGPLSIGKSTFTVIAGPCSIESEEQFVPTSQYVMETGASIVRGGIFKMRTQPDAFKVLVTKPSPLLKKCEKL